MGRDPKVAKLPKSQLQIKIKKKIESILKNYSDKKLLGLAYDKTTKKLIQELISLKKEENWFKVVVKILKGLRDLLNREIEKAKPILTIFP